MITAIKSIMIPPTTYYRFNKKKSFIIQYYFEKFYYNCKKENHYFLHARVEPELVASSDLSAEFDISISKQTSIC